MPAFGASVAPPAFGGSTPAFGGSTPAFGGACPCLAGLASVSLHEGAFVVGLVKKRR